MKLLIKRDTTQLMETEGRAELKSDVPEVLKTPRVVPNFEVNRIQKRVNDDLLITNKEDYAEIDNHLQITNRQQQNLSKNCLGKITLTGIWSGYRSVLVSNGNGGLYRLKGVSFNPEKPKVMEYNDGTHEVWGGQPLQSARFEKKMSDKFNRILENEGITPIMTCKGYWHYPTKIKRRKLACSVIQVEGDTRLDEFMFLIENYFRYRIKKRENGKKHFVNQRGAELGSAISHLYYGMGLTTGRLKKLMDKNNQTWSADSDRSNAHIGNIVLYNGTDKVRFGFVDFDASCDTNDFSKSKIKEMQKREYQTIINSAKQGTISPREMQIGFLQGQNALSVFPQFREKFIKGFEGGYQSKDLIRDNASIIGKGIYFSKFLEIFNILRDLDCSLVPKPKENPRKNYRFGGLSSIYDNPYGDDFYGNSPLIKKLEKSENDLYGILNKNKNYQKNLINLEDKYNLLNKSYFKGI